MNPQNDNERLTIITSNKYDRVDTETDKGIHGAFDKCDEKFYPRETAGQKAKSNKKVLDL